TCRVSYSHVALGLGSVRSKRKGNPLMESGSQARMTPASRRASTRRSRFDSIVDANQNQPAVHSAATATTPAVTIMYVLRRIVPVTLLVRERSLSSRTRRVETKALA